MSVAEMVTLAVVSAVNVVLLGVVVRQWLGTYRETGGRVVGGVAVAAGLLACENLVVLVAVTVDPTGFAAPGVGRVVMVGRLVQFLAVVIVLRVSMHA